MKEDLKDKVIVFSTYFLSKFFIPEIFNGISLSGEISECALNAFEIKYNEIKRV